MKLKIAVAVHKPYPFPTEEIYQPILAGSASGRALPGVQPDDVGDNISEKNPYFCELTVLYWAWKHFDADYIGLVHYRRYFGKKRLEKEPFRCIASRSEMEKALKKADILLPKKRDYFIETNYSHYAHAHHREDLDLIEEILRRDYPQYLPAFEAVMKRTKAHRFNMMVMSREKLDWYCTWLFDILFKAEQKINPEVYDPYNQRVYGFLAERLLDVWLETNHLDYTDLPVIHLERQNWIKKGSAFLYRKFKKR